MTLNGNEKSRVPIARWNVASRGKPSSDDKLISNGKTRLGRDDTSQALSTAPTLAAQLTVAALVGHETGAVGDGTATRSEVTVSRVWALTWDVVVGDTFRINAGTTATIRTADLIVISAVIIGGAELIAESKSAV